MNKILIPVTAGLAVLVLLGGGWYWYRGTQDVRKIIERAVSTVGEELATREDEAEDDPKTTEEIAEAYEDEPSDEKVPTSVTPPAPKSKLPAPPPAPRAAAPDVSAAVTGITQEFAPEAQAEDDFTSLEETSDAYADET
jgi:hypothetical protein